MERISNYQLYVLTVLYQIGTTIVFGFGAVAGRDAWISVLISSSVGLIIMLLYTLLMRMNPGLTLVEWWRAQFGKWIGTPIAWAYTLLILYEVGRGVGDLKFLIPITILPKTPIFIVLIVFMIVLIYGAFAGIEVIARLGEIVFPVILFLFPIEIILIFGSHIMNIQHLQPIAGKGWSQILEAVWPVGITQSFGESIELAMIWPLVSQPEKIIRTTLLATITSGLFIAIFDAIAVATLGGALFENSIYPMYTLIQQISLGEFVDNLDAIEVLYFLTTIFFKISIHMFAVVRAIQKLTLVKNSRVFILPVSAIALYLGMTMSSNILVHIETSLKMIQYNLFVPLFIILPSILFVVTLIRGKYRKNEKYLKS